MPLTLNKHPRIDALVAKAARLGPLRAAITYPCSSSSIEAMYTAQQLGIIEPVLVGPKGRIVAIAETLNIDLSCAEFVDCEDDPVSAAEIAIALGRDSQVHFIAKGSLRTDVLLAAAVRKESGLRATLRMSHTFLCDVPTYSKPLFLTDCALNIAPGLMEKRDITQNAIDLAQSLGVEQPLVGILSPIETINPSIPGSLEAAALSKMAERGQISGGIVDGPVSLDIAFSLEAAHSKGIDSPISGRPDILIVPNLEAGNLLYKQLVYLSGAECAGVVLGTRTPIALTSRAATPKSYVASCALTAIHASGQTQSA